MSTGWTVIWSTTVFANVISLSLVNFFGVHLFQQRDKSKYYILLSFFFFFILLKQEMLSHPWEPWCVSFSHNTYIYHAIMFDFFDSHKYWFTRQIPLDIETKSTQSNADQWINFKYEKIANKRLNKQIKWIRTKNERANKQNSQLKSPVCTSIKTHTHTSSFQCNNTFQCEM